MLKEIKDLLSGIAFPFIISLIFSASVISFASYTADIAVSVIALVGGEIMFALALVLFGKANGAAAYRKTVLHEQKRQLNSTEEEVIYHTGEYELYKGFLIGFVICVPFIIIQAIELIVPNVFCSFCLEYLFAWAYYPFSYLGKQYQALNFILVLFPVAVHTVAYFFGKKKEIKVQAEAAAKATRGKKKGKK